MKTYLFLLCLGSKFLYSSEKNIEGDNIKKIFSSALLFSTLAYVSYKGIKYIRYLKHEGENLKRENELLKEEKNALAGDLRFNARVSMNLLEKISAENFNLKEKIEGSGAIPDVEKHNLLG